MTDKALGPDHHDDDLDPGDAQAVYQPKGVGRKRERSSRGNGPVPMSQGSSTTPTSSGASAPGGAQPGPNAGINTGLTPLGHGDSAAVVATGLAATAVSGPLPGEADVRFQRDQLTARSGGSADDPWGAYSNPDNIPGAQLDDEVESNDQDRSGMAMRSSGTRGKSKGRADGSMGPMMPMAGGAGGGASVVAPGATLGGVGAAPGLVAQQSASYHSVMSGAQQGSLPLSSLAAMQSGRASSAMFSPAGSGVLAAGQGTDMMDEAALAESLRRIGINSDEPSIIGPDGNIYPNPFHGSLPTQPGERSAGLPKGADLNGDGVISADEAHRWTGGNSRTGDGATGGIGTDTSWGPAGQNGPASTFPGSSKGGLRTASEPEGRTSTTDADDGSVPQGGVKAEVDAMDRGSYSGSSAVGSSTRTQPEFGAFGAPPMGAVSKGSGHGTATGSDLAFSADEILVNSREWERISEAQRRLAKQFQRLADPALIFGVLHPMVGPYNQVKQTSFVESAKNGEESQYTAGSMQETIEAYEANEEAAAVISEGMND